MKVEACLRRDVYVLMSLRVCAFLCTCYRLFKTINKFLSLMQMLISNFNFILLSDFLQQIQHPTASLIARVATAQVFL